MSTATATTLRDLIRHIVTEHHGYLRKNLPLIADRISSAGDAELGAAFETFRSDLMNHLSKEEAMLFPAIDRFESAVEAGEPLPEAHFGSVRLPVQMLEEEHLIAAGGLGRIRELTRDFTQPPGPISDALRSLEADLREHLRLENEVLFPGVLKLEKIRP